MEDFNDAVDGKLASRMRQANPEQFYTLVKMHLSFELDINTEDNDPVTEKAKLKKWGLLNFSKKPKSMMMNLHNQKHGVSPEGSALTTEGINQVKLLIAYLSKEQCISQEGIFRRTGKLKRQQDLKLLLYQGQSLNLEDGTYNVHDCASVLKSFLAELSEPLLTELYYPIHCQIAELCNSDSMAMDSRLLISIQLLLLLLPSNNRILLKHLLSLLNKTATYESSNKMNCDTLATLFTPHLMCPRKLTPEALHINSQHLSCLVAFMIKKGEELFEIPVKLATDIRAYWVDQERKLLSPNNKDAMPESAKKRRLVKQFNKENGQGTPRHIKHQLRTKSLGDSIKKHIFQKKILGNKKLIDINIGCNISRCSSEENLHFDKYNKKSMLSSQKSLSKSEDELSTDSFISLDNDNLNHSKCKSDRTDCLSTPSIGRKIKKKLVVLDLDTENDSICKDSPVADQEGLLDVMKSSENVCITFDKSIGEVSEIKSKEQTLLDITNNVRRHNSEPPNVYSSKELVDKSPTASISNKSDSLLPPRSSPDNEILTIPGCSEISKPVSSCSKKSSTKGNSSSPKLKTKLWLAHSAAYTSTPSDLLRRNLPSDYGLTPITRNDKSMSPITQSATKMTKAMQETMMTPRSRKPVMILSATNLCNLSSVNKADGQSEPANQLKVVNIDIDGDGSDDSINEESPMSKIDSVDVRKISCEVNSENYSDHRRPTNPVLNATDLNDDCINTQPSCMSITSTFREYLLSRSVLTASPVDLSFTSRTDDYEQSESDFNGLDENGLSDSLLHCLDGNIPSSDTSGVVSGSTNDSFSNSTEKIQDGNLSPRKRSTSLQRNDSKRSIKSCQHLNDSQECDDNVIINPANEMTINSIDLKDTFQETSF
ncbi:Similar to ARHGAP19: Rho GTPase-activating protein 19 (Homo sapiens) [Cotesia congregata]|uniref:Similar to ARHGAP19: Rho GTPase-activating protein 19 (Homo sapiens) n=1 Tax=Cotesia congregata TaxID=51543 RepID=A0A8J2H677_COTCN|nr:Similar to ARHGAP19: Rho GTPase-activating protein 19 (Homo sapiens) [Cotesia congregata]